MPGSRYSFRLWHFLLANIALVVLDKFFLYSSLQCTVFSNCVCIEQHIYWGEWPSGPASSISLTEVKHGCVLSETGWATSR